ncbi:MAG: AAA family ATPase, partial [Clostridia bacterium]|nr:AAA family ATPase [Clostridia bacterium]
MYLKSLEIQGFKSFPDKTRLEFGRGMTAVVGPNGSGKSNIADAVRWVLGEQSAKSLRSSRMEDVIFSGTAQRRAVGYAQVTLGLDNTDRELDFDSNEVMVSRRYYRSGESEYLINGEQVRLLDIHELFMDTGLGSDGYSMVSQGRVEEMVSQRSDQRREIFEEAVGIHGFRVKRDEATRRLDQAEENLVRLRDIMSELESRIGPLKEQSEKAVRYLALAEERKNIEIALWLRTLAQSDNSVREQAGKTETVRIQYENAEEKLKEICEQEEKAREDANAVTISIESVTRERSDAQTRAAELDAQAKIDLAEISAGDEEIKRLLAELDGIRISREKLESDILTANEDFEAFKKKSEDLSKQAEESIESSGSLLEEIAA